MLIISFRVVFGYEGNSKIVVKGSGSGGLDELKGSLEDDQVNYGYLRVTSGDSESKRSKFVFISWVGEKVGPLKRAKVSVHKAGVKQVVQVCLFSSLYSPSPFALLSHSFHKSVSPFLLSISLLPSFSFSDHLSIRRFNF